MGGLSARATSTKAWVERMSYGPPDCYHHQQLCLCAPVAYWYVERTGTWSNEGVFASAICTRWHPNFYRTKRKLSVIICRDEIETQRGLSSMEEVAAITLTGG